MGKPNAGFWHRSSKKKTGKIALTKECVAYNLTPELMDQGTSTGESLGYEKEYWAAGVAMGIDFAAGTPGFVAGLTINSYIYKGAPTDTPNATYQTAAGTGTSCQVHQVNKLTERPCRTHKNFQAV